MRATEYARPEAQFMASGDDQLLRLLEQIRADFDRLRFEAGPIAAMLTHRATNAEAEGVKGHPRPRGETVAFMTVGNREGGQCFDEKGNALFRSDPIVDVNGNPIVNSAGDAFDIVMPAHRNIEFTGHVPDYQKLDSVAERAGRLLGKMKSFPSADLLSGWRFLGAAEIWWALVFEIAWANRHPLVTTKRQIWAPADTPTAFYPYDLDALRRLAKFPPGATRTLPDNWLKRLPDAFVSDLDNVGAVSFDIADYLVAESKPKPAALKTKRPKAKAAPTINPPAPETTPRRFAVALSFPGEHRGIVEPVATALADALDRSRVFYDRFHEVELCRPNLDLVLQDFYRKDSDLIVVFVCGEYKAKDWCGIEWRAIRDLMKDRSLDDRRVMFLRLDKAPLPGLLSLDGFLDITAKDSRQIADFILRRWTMMK